MTSCPTKIGSMLSDFDSCDIAKTCPRRTDLRTDLSGANLATEVELEVHLVVGPEQPEFTKNLHLDLEVLLITVLIFVFLLVAILGTKFASKVRGSKWLFSEFTNKIQL